MPNPKNAGDRFARNGIIFAIVVLVVTLLSYAYLHYSTSIITTRTTAKIVPSTPAVEAHITESSGSVCQPGELPPKALNPIGDYDIIANNVALITSAPTFDGKNLTFSVTAKPKNIKNIVTIHAKTGVIRIQAEAKDKFDVTVLAKNPCGQAVNTFNILIEEEE